MLDIYWSKLSTFEKVIFVLGWFSVFNAVFWVAFIVTYIIGKERGGRYKEFFNPHTLKVPYVFGWIHLVLILLCLIVFITMFSFIAAMMRMVW
ncbi:MAG: hypothetical protein Q7R76_06270 [Candidatus Woesearchaeota archaeon]|nr:hypothetical protein [Candidatus Woesearchaeota archaeon]